MWRLLLVPVLLLAACGETTDPQASGTGTEPTPVQGAPAAMISCGGGGGGAPGWPATAMVGGIETETPPDEIDAALAATTDEMGIDAPPIEPWIALAEDDDRLTLGTGHWDADGPGRDAMVVTYERTADGLGWSGHGQCLRLAPVLSDDEDWVEMTAPPGGLDRETTELTVLVMEHQCTGARDPLPFLNEPTVDQGPGQVVVAWTSPVPEGGADCQGNPRVETVLRLDEPLGDRDLLDGSTWPPTPVE